MVFIMNMENYHFMIYVIYSPFKMAYIFRLS